MSDNAVTAEWRSPWKLENVDYQTKILRTPIVVMMDSGARGNISNFTAAGMRGLMAVRTDGSWNR